MAVYTRFPQEALIDFLNQYDIGTYEHHQEIAQGVENSNYLLWTSKGKYILTLYEKRVNIDDLPYFLNFSVYLKKNNINTPPPIRSKKGAAFSDFLHKKAAIITFLDGQNLDIPNSAQCQSAGDFVARMHIAQKGFEQKRANQLSPTHSLWQLYDLIKETMADKLPKYASHIDKEINFLKENYPQSGLEIGNIHADIFPDNMFFKQNKAVGIIDFYFSCTDFILYDLGIVICAWCFDHGVFQPEKYQSLIQAYHKVRLLDTHERAMLPLIMRGAAMRFFLTRAHDYIFHDPKALVHPKNPEDYYKIITFLQNSNYPQEVLCQIL